MSKLPKHAGTGIGIAVLGLILTVVMLLTFGNSSTFAPVITIYASLGIGVYFLGLNVATNCIIKQNENAEILTEIQQIKNKLDSGIIITQNVTAVVNSKKSEKERLHYYYGE